MSEAPRTEDPRRRETRRAPSVVIVNTGDGKGKSTAAMGMVMRSVARNWQVAVVQFIKSGKWKVGEEKMGHRLGVEWIAGGDGFSWDSEDLDRSAELNRETWDLARRRIEAGTHRLVVLDEITYPISYGWLDVQEVIGALRERPADMHVILTGRDAAPELVEFADLVTEMTEVKHPFQQGVKAQPGLDF